MSATGFEIGERVTWTSQAAGIATTKVGVVLAVVRSGQYPDEAAKAVGVKGRVGDGMPRNHVSYVVRANGRLYWPRATMLRLAGEESLHV